MKTFASIAVLAALVFISAEARPREDDMIVEFAIGAPSENYSIIKLADLMEKYGRKLALVGRIISNLGDSITGMGRWLKQKNGQYTDVRSAIADIGEQLGRQEMSTSETYIAVKVLAATLTHVAQTPDLTDSEVENYLSESLVAISEKMIVAAKDADVDAEKVDDATLAIFEKIVGDS